MNKETMLKLERELMLAVKQARKRGDYATMMELAAGVAAICRGHEPAPMMPPPLSAAERALMGEMHLDLDKVSPPPLVMPPPAGPTLRSLPSGEAP